MKNPLLLFLLFLCHTAASQNYDKVWAFGIHSGLDFNSQPPALVSTAIVGYEGVASIADDNGLLQFYTNGLDVWDRNHQLMPNGAGIMQTLPGYSVSTSTQQAAIIRFPGNTNRYYVFSLNDVESRVLYYSVVDMTLNGGLGDVVPGMKTIPLDSMLTEKMSVVAGNNCDVWLMVRALGPAQYRAYPVSAAGIGAPVVSNIGSGGTVMSYAQGYLVFSPDRSRMAVAALQRVELFNFDATTGIVSGMQVLPSANQPFPDSYYGLCFSPDNSKLYTASITGGTDQFDISLPTTAAIIASRVELDNTISSDMRLAVDGKIYLPQLGTANVRRIEFPNLAGTACQFNSNALTLDTISFYGLPNYNVAFRRDSVHTRHLRYLCNDTVVLSPFNAGIDYRWENNQGGASRTVSQPGIYVLRYHYICSYFTDTFLVLPRPPFPALLSRKGDCGGAGGSLLFAQAAGDTVAYQYTLYDAAQNTVAQYSGNTGWNPSGLPPGSYTLRIATAGSCDTALSLEIPLWPAPVAGFSHDGRLCAGEQAFFHNTTTGAYETLNWYFGDGASASGASPGHRYEHAGTYTVLLVAADTLCADTAIGTVQVNAFTLELTADNMYPAFGAMVLLQTRAAEAYNVTAWYPAALFPQQQALSQQTQADSTRTYLAVGYSLASQCSDTASLRVPVQPVVALPDAFSPNGDGLNDYFRPHLWGNNISVTRFEVFDRWGRKVWSAGGDEALRGWDGRYGNGSTANMGTYYWYIRYSAEGMGDALLKGDVVLLP